MLCLRKLRWVVFSDCYSSLFPMWLQCKIVQRGLKLDFLSQSSTDMKGKVIGSGFRRCAYSWFTVTGAGQHKTIVAMGQPDILQIRIHKISLAIKTRILMVKRWLGCISMYSTPARQIFSSGSYHIQFLLRPLLSTTSEYKYCLPIYLLSQHFDKQWDIKKWRTILWNVYEIMCTLQVEGKDRNQYPAAVQ